MPLSYDETTPLTEAIENTTKFAMAAALGVTQQVEQMVSDATRKGGAEATAADLVTNAARLYTSWLNGISQVTTAMVDGLALVSGQIARHFTSEDETFPPQRRPGDGEKWLLRVESAALHGQELPVSGIHLLNGSREPISTNLPLPVALDSSWDGAFIVIPRIPGFTPGGLSLGVQPVDAADAATAIGARIDLIADIIVDISLVGS